jgi:hypothetical protein
VSNQERAREFVAGLSGGELGDWLDVLPAGATLAGIELLVEHLLDTGWEPPE